jgi:hypothetical protein
MDGFSQTVEHWQAFYMMAGTAAATLLGLLFVAISINLDLIIRDENVSLGALASETINNFVYVLFVAITFLIPNQTPLGLGIPLLAIGVFGLLDNGRFLMTALRNRKPQWGLAYIFWRFIFPLIALLALVVISVFVLQGNVRVLYGLVFVIIILLAVAILNSWVLLIRVHKQAT